MTQRGRPHMIRYGIHEDDQGMIEWAWVDEQMTKSRNYWIATVTPDGKPHAAPVWGIWYEGALYFGSDRESRKAKNITANPAVAVHLESGDDAVMLEGTAERITDGDLLDTLSQVYGAKYSGYTPDFRNEQDTMIFMVKPRKAFAWKESDFPKTATRWVFEN